MSYYFAWLSTYKLLDRFEPNFKAHSITQRFVKITSADGDRCFARAAADLWNILPKKLQQSDSTAVFKNNIKNTSFLCGIFRLKRCEPLCKVDAAR